MNLRTPTSFGRTLSHFRVDQLHRIRAGRLRVLLAGVTLASTLLKNREAHGWTFRRVDGVALLVDGSVDPLLRIPAVPPRNIADGVRVIDTRAHALKATDLIDDAALDRYTFVRDGYLARRRGLVLDGRSTAEESSSPGVGPASGK